jgi:hypothetical protein
LGVYSREKGYKHVIHSCGQLKRARVEIDAYEKAKGNIYGAIKPRHHHNRSHFLDGREYQRQAIFDREKEKKFSRHHSEVVVIILFKILCKKKNQQKFFFCACDYLDTFTALVLRDFTHVGG